ncbi:MAG: hypothetical protein Q9178_002452 [Gyalolechia marmorata]
MRRIDLVAKLVAPLFISFVDAASTYAALWVVLGSSLASVTVEYFAIAQVYHAVPELARPLEATELSDHIMEPADAQDTSTPNQKPGLEHILAYINGSFSSWYSYLRSPVLLASLSLCILYLTVLSFNAQMITYLLASGFTATWVSVFRLISVVVELAATWAGPMLMSQIGPTRSGLWFITWQSVCATLGVALFSTAALELRMRNIALISGVIMSRIGLWGFDLSVQFLVQEEVASVSRSQFSATEAALQNLFEMLSFATTSIFAKPVQFQYPALISVGATMVANLCFTTYVKQIRGHLFHKSRCLARPKYTRVDDSDEKVDLHQLKFKKELLGGTWMMLLNTTCTIVISSTQSSRLSEQPKQFIDHGHTQTTAISNPTRIKPVMAALELSPATGPGDGDLFDAGVELVIGVGPAMGAIVVNATII